MINKILELIVPDAVCLNMDAKDSAEVIRTLGEKLLAAGYVKESFVAAALSRESELPTGLPLGAAYNAAIPHTDAEHVLHSALAVATLKHPVIFQNMVDPDAGVEVHLVILMALDHPKVQVEMLQEVALVLQDSATIEGLVQASSIEEVFASLKG
ncbi:MAG: PTS sugar transporter subunit IIA [Anaerolineaceae bacterium]|jgi:PTS system galactitol-specific IIA component|nr:PTS sugar transporter subunit IIA [Anaerolineaceae bacterium]